MGVYKYDSTNDELNPIAGSTTYADLAVGSIIPYGGATPPISFLICDGAEVAKEDYPELYAVIGDLFGTATEATHFMLPDLRESVPVGVGKNITKSIANHDRYNLGQFKDDALGTHDHPLKTVTTATYNTAGVPVGVATNNTPTTATHGKQVGVNYIIKAKNTGYPSDIGDAVENLVEDLMDDYQTKALETPLTIGGTSQTTVEGALGGLNTVSASTKSHFELLGAEESKELDIYIDYNFYQDDSTFDWTTAKITSLCAKIATLLDEKNVGRGLIKCINGYEFFGHYNYFVSANVTYFDAVVSSYTKDAHWHLVKNGTLTNGYRIFDTDTYSTSETLTNKVFQNGKPVYRKCGFVAGPITPTNHYVLDSGLTTSVVENILDAGGSGKMDGNILCVGGYISTPSAVSETRLNVGIFGDGLKLLTTQGTVTSLAWWVEYTKTTN